MRSGTFWLRYRTPSDSGKYIEFGLRVETGAERTTIIVDIFHIIEQVRDTGIHLKVDQEQMEDHSRKYEASGWNWVPRLLLVRVTTHRYSLYVDI